MAKRISWTALKERQSRTGLPLDWIEEPEYYRIIVAGLVESYEVILDRTETSADLTDFETNFRPNPQPLSTNGATNVTVQGGCPTIQGSKFRAKIDDNDITLSTSSYTTIWNKTTPGILQSFVIDFTSDRVDVKLTIDGQDVFNIDLDDLEDIEADYYGGSDGRIGCSFKMQTGSRFTFCPPCGLTYNTLTISAQAEQNNKKKDSILVEWVEG